MTQCRNKFPTSYVAKVDIVNKLITIFLTKYYKAMWLRQSSQDSMLICDVFPEIICYDHIYILYNLTLSWKHAGMA